MNLEIFNERVRKLASEESQRLIENDPDKYYQYTADYGYYDNGVVKACYGREKVYDEDRAYEDAIEAIAIDVANGGEYYHLLEDNAITTELANYIRKL